MNNYHKTLSCVIDYGYHFTIEPLIYVYWGILVQICVFFIFDSSDSVSV